MSDLDNAQKQAKQDHWNNPNTTHKQPHETPSYEVRQAYNEEIDRQNAASNSGKKG